MQLTSRLVNTSENSSRLRQRPLPERDRRGDHPGRRVVLGLGVARLGDLGGGAGVDVHRHDPHEVLVAVDVAVERRRGHPDLGGHRPQRHLAGAGHQLPGRLDDASQGVGTVLLAGGGGHVAAHSPSSGPGLTGYEFTPLTVNAVHYAPQEFPCCTGGQRSSSAGRASSWRSACSRRSSAGVFGLGVFDSLGQGGFNDPKSEASRELTQEQDAFGNKSVDMVAIYTSKDLTVSDPEFRAQVEKTLARIPAGATTSVATYWQTPRPLDGEQGQARHHGADLADRQGPVRSSPTAASG